MNLDRGPARLRAELQSQRATIEAQARRIAELEDTIDQYDRAIERLYLAGRLDAALLPALLHGDTSGKVARMLVKTGEDRP